MLSNSSCQILNSLFRIGGRTIRLAAVGAATGVSAAGTAGGIVTSKNNITALEAIHQALIVSPTGGAVIGGGIGFLEGILFELSPEFTRWVRDCAQDKSGFKLLTMFFLLMYVCKEIAGAITGRHIIGDDITFSDEDAAVYGGIGGLATFCGMFFLIAISILATHCVNENACNTLVDFVGGSLEYIAGLPSAAEIEELDSQQEQNNLRRGRP